MSLEKEIDERGDEWLRWRSKKGKVEAEFLLAGKELEFKPSVLHRIGVLVAMGLCCATAGLSFLISNFFILNLFLIAHLLFFGVLLATLSQSCTRLHGNERDVVEWIRFREKVKNLEVFHSDWYAFILIEVSLVSVCVALVNGLMFLFFPFLLAQPFYLSSLLLVCLIAVSFGIGYFYRIPILLAKNRLVGSVFEGRGSIGKLDRQLGLPCCNGVNPKLSASGAMVCIGLASWLFFSFESRIDKRIQAHLDAMVTFELSEDRRVFDFLYEDSFEVLIRDAFVYSAEGEKFFGVRIQKTFREEPLWPGYTVEKKFVLDQEYDDDKALARKVLERIWPRFEQVDHKVVAFLKGHIEPVKGDGYRVLNRHLAEPQRVWLMSRLARIYNEVAILQLQAGEVEKSIDTIVRMSRFIAFLPDSQVNPRNGAIRRLCPYLRQALKQGLFNEQQQFKVISVLDSQSPLSWEFLLYCYTKMELSMGLNHLRLDDPSANVLKSDAFEAYERHLNWYQYPELARRLAESEALLKNAEHELKNSIIELYDRQDLRTFMKGIAVQDD